MQTFRAIALASIAPMVASAQSAPRPVHFFGSLAFTFGGDTLGTVTYTDGSTSSVKAGGETFIKAGLDWQVARKVSVQGSIGYHTDSTKEAKNGDMKFTRVPLETLAFYHVNDTFRVGGGLRKATSAELKTSGAASLGSFDFDSSTGFILEGEFRRKLGRVVQGGFSIRYVNEKYTPTRYDGITVTGSTIDGSHFGLGVSLYL